MPPRLVLLLCWCILGGLFAGPVSGQPKRRSAPVLRSTGAMETSEPDPRRAKALGRWADDRDLARLKSVEGKPKRKVLEVLGHPSAVKKGPNGTEVWEYPWLAACRVSIRKGICTETFYTAGY
jgi:hypothetical protein